jgi:hypothetical protein
MPAVNYPRWMVQLDWLVTTIQSATVPGGVLAGIANVERVVPPERNIFPSIGLMCDGYTLSKYAMRARKVAITFTIMVACKRDFSASVDDTTAQALHDLRGYCDDGMGGGLSTLLTSDPTMSGFAVDSIIQSCRFAVWQNKASTASTLATATYTLAVEDVVRF